MAKALARRWTLAEPQAAALLLLLGVACPLLVLLPVRALPPQEPPSLRLPAEPVRALLAEDAKRARRAPEGDAAEALDALMDAQGLAEQQVVEGVASYTQRRKELIAAYQALVAAEGEAAALDARAAATARFDAALELRLPADRVVAVMGAMPSVLEREEATRDGYLVAPGFVARTLYKARWNLLCGLPPEHALADIEQRAFFGWKALHSQRLPVQQRVDAVARYRASGGEHADEAIGALLYEARDFARAAAALEAAARASGALRLRNHAMGARVWAKTATLDSPQGIP